MVFLGFPETHGLKKPKETVLGSWHEGCPAGSHLRVPSMGCMLESWRGGEPLLLIF